MARSTWHFYSRFMLIENYLIHGLTDIKNGKTIYTILAFDSPWEAQERAIALTEAVETKGYTLVEGPLQRPIELDPREWLDEVNSHRDMDQILERTYKHIRNLGQPLDRGAP